MFGRKYLSICTLTLIVLCLGVNAMPEPEVPEPVSMVQFENDIETLSIIDDLLEILRKYLTIAEECVVDARDSCSSASSQNPILGLRCIVKYIISQKGKCQINI